MPTLKLTVLVEQDGLPLVISPIIRRVVVDDVQGFYYQLASGGGDVALPTNQIAALDVLVVQALERATTVKLPSIALDAGGVVIVCGGTPTTPTIANASGQPVTVQGVGGGS